MIRNLALRLATHDDAAVIARMSRDLIEQGLGWSWTTPRVLRSVRSPDTNVVLALDDQRSVGFAIMKYLDAEAHLLLLAVRPEVQRSGVGTALTRWVEASAIAAGIGQVYLEARVSNHAARAFYGRLGYGEVQSLPGYYQGREAAVRMARDLWLGDEARGGPAAD